MNCSLKKIVFFLLFFDLLFVVLSCKNVERNSQVSIANKESQPSEIVFATGDFTSRPDILAKLNRLFSVKSEDAIKFVQDKQKLTDKDAKSLIPCDNGEFWRVINPKTNQEFTIYKGSTQAPGTVTFLKRNVFESITERNASIDQQDAITLAKKHFIEYGKDKFNSDGHILDMYFPSVCDVGDYWRVMFLLYEYENLERTSDIAKLPNAHPPDYLIDKKNGEIIYFNYFDVH